MAALGLPEKRYTLVVDPSSRSTVPAVTLVAPLSRSSLFTSRLS